VDTGVSAAVGRLRVAPHPHRRRLVSTRSEMRFMLGVIKWYPGKLFKFAETHYGAGKFILNRTCKQQRRKIILIIFVEHSSAFPCNTKEYS
jgi:hypothetical protein